MLTQLKAEIKKLADPKKAKILQRFFKTGKGEYGEGDKFLGIMVPVQRQLVKKYWQSLNLKNIDRLLKSKIHEERLIALLVLVKLFTAPKVLLHQRTSYKSSEAFLSDKTLVKLGAKEDTLMQKGIFDFYLKHTHYINNWDLVDLSAPKIVGAFLRNRDKKILYKLAKSKNLWERRIAILATFDFIYYGDAKDALRISKILINDKHDLIHKATGWMLREVGKRCGQQYLLGFLDKNRVDMPRTMLRYAIERLPAKLRLKYLSRV